MAFQTTDSTWSGHNPMSQFFKPKIRSLAYRLLLEKEQREIDKVFSDTPNLKPMAGIWGYDTRQVQKGINSIIKLRGRWK